jgi:outer membrane protein assembly factor BamB
MIFNEIEKLKGVEKFLIDKSIFYKSGDNLFYLLFPLETNLILKEVYDFTLMGETIYYQKENLKSLFAWDLKSNVRTELIGEFSLTGKFLGGKSNLYVLGEDKGNPKIFVISKDSFEMTFSIDNNFPLLVLETPLGLLFKRKGALICINIQENNEVWQYSLPNNNRIAGKIHLCENVLVVPTSNYNLVGIDVASGSFLWELPNCLQFYSKHESGFLFGYGLNTYQVVDPRKGEIIIEKNFKNESEKLRIAPASNEHFIYKDKMYFISNFYGSKFGSIDLVKHEISFVQDLGLEEGITAYTPSYHEGRLFILDTCNTLHIYEASKI